MNFPTFVYPIPNSNVEAVIQGSTGSFTSPGGTLLCSIMRRGPYDPSGRNYADAFAHLLMARLMLRDHPWEIEADHTEASVTVRGCGNERDFKKFCQEVVNLAKTPGLFAIPEARYVYTEKL